MWSLVFRRARLRLALGLAVSLSLPLWLPAAPSTRVHVVTWVALLAPWLVLGRDARRRREGLRAALRLAPAGGRLVLAEFVPGLLVCAVGAGAALGATPGAALVVFCWAAMLLCVTDALERRAASAGGAFARVWIAAVAVLSAPWWAVTWLGGPALDPWPSTLAVGLHPAGAALSGAGLSTLQDPDFYIWTLSGVVETRPLPASLGSAVFASIALLAVALAIRATRFPERRVA